jgi:hypothetical protein
MIVLIYNLFKRILSFCFILLEKKKNQINFFRSFFLLTIIFFILFFNFVFLKTYRFKTKTSLMLITFFSYTLSFFLFICTSKFNIYEFFKAAYWVLFESGTKHYAVLIFCSFFLFTDNYIFPIGLYLDKDITVEELQNFITRAFLLLLFFHSAVLYSFYLFWAGRGKPSLF